VLFILKHFARFSRILDSLRFNYLRVFGGVHAFGHSSAIWL